MNRVALIVPALLLSFSLGGCTGGAAVTPAARPGCRVRCSIRGTQPRLPALRMRRWRRRKKVRIWATDGLSSATTISWSGAGW